MIAYNIYIEQLANWRVAFLIKFQELKLFSKAFETIIKLGSKFVNNMKWRRNWKQASYSK